MSAISSDHDAELQDKKVSEPNEILPGYPTMQDFTKEGFGVLMEAIRNSNALPNGSDWGFYNAHEAFGSIMGNEGNKILRLMNKVLHVYDVEGNIRNRLLDEKVELVVEANDVILERVANNIDELNGVKKNVVAPIEIQTVSAQLPINGSWNRVTNARFSVSNSMILEKQSTSVNSIRLLTAKNIIRPQKFFKDKIDNSNRPWEPRITEKPNSLKPLAIFLEETEYGDQYSHPYDFELERFSPPEEQLQLETPVVPKLVSDTPLIEIADPEQLNDLLETLRQCKEFAVDLEHHSYRTFMGITCLMQISTKDTDYLIDTLALRDKLYVLNEVFTKPTILKIFHGADSDIPWLQRDLSLYVVNMFDTYQAAKLLEYPTLSLAYLMKKFCNFLPNKQFQLADWRIRPLPDELKSYAREDTHYLIYIYQMLKQELLKKGNKSDNFLKVVYQKSREVCLKRYIKPILREDSHLEFYRKCKRNFHNRQLYALKGLYKWRDELSRVEDESTGYVLPNHMLLQISENLPREMQGILACCNPTPPLVKSNLLELHQIILKARDQPVEKAILKEDSRSRGGAKQLAKVNMDSPLHCPHDLSKSSEFRDDLPTLLNNRITNEAFLMVEIEKTKSHYTIFNVSHGVDIDNEKLSKVHKVRFLTPYQRYKLAKKFIRAEDEKAAAAAAAAESQPNNSTEKDEQESMNATEGKGEKTDVVQRELTDRERTDEERISSIREHFLQLSRKSEEEEKQKREIYLSCEENNTLSLLQMGGTKKRKREHSPEDAPDHSGNVAASENDLHNPRPSVFTRIDLSKKRRSSEAFGETGLPQFFNKKKKFGNNNPQKPNRNKNVNMNRNNKNANPNSEQVNASNQQAQGNVQSVGGKSNRPNKFKKKKKKNAQFNKNQERTGSEQIESHCNSKEKIADGERGAVPDRLDNKTDTPGPSNDNIDKFAANQSTSKYPQKPGRNSRNQQRNRKPQKWKQQENFKPYDYSSVDFSEFQGGGGTANTPHQFNSNFRGKRPGRSRGKNKGNRSSMLGNAPGRGKGR